MILIFDFINDDIADISCLAACWFKDLNDSAFGGEEGFRNIDDPNIVWNALGIEGCWSANKIASGRNDCVLGEIGLWPGEVV